MLVIPSGGTYPGIWSRSVCVDEGLLKGSMLPFFHRAMETNMGIIVLNPNVNSYSSVDSSGQSTLVPLPFNETPENHLLYVWDHIISRTSARNLVILAYGQGGSHAKSFLQLREQALLPKLRAMALVASTHRLNSELSFGLSETESKTTRAFLEKHTINWMSSTVEVGQRVFVHVMWKDDA